MAFAVTAGAGDAGQWFQDTAGRCPGAYAACGGYLGLCPSPRGTIRVTIVVT